MRQLFLLLGLMWGGLFISGCGSSYNYTPGHSGQQPVPEPPQAPATIVVEHVLARAVPSTITSFRFIGTDQRGQTVLGPITRPRTSQVRLTPVPLTIASFTIEYLEGEAVVGRYATDIAISAGETITLSNPAWVDVSSVGEPAKLAIRAVPGASDAGMVLAPPLTVEILDEKGNLVTTSTASVSVALDPATATLGGTTTVSAVGGVATFTDLTISTRGSYRLVVTSPGLAGDSSLPVEVTEDPVATGLEFSVQPIDGAAQMASVEVRVLDQFGALFPGFTGTISLALGNNTTGATLTGTTEVAATLGVARFNSLALTLAGQDYTLIASAPGTNPATSTAFDITLGQLNRTLFSLVTPVEPTNLLNSGVETGDFNSDGLLDTLTAAPGSERVVLLLQTSDGDFRERGISVPGVRKARTGDIDGDGKPDLITLELEGTTYRLSVRLGNGDATFGAVVSVPLNSTEVVGFQVADLNSDGLVDVALSTLEPAGPSVGVSLSNGSALGALSTVALTGSPTSVGPLALGRLTNENTHPGLAVIADNTVLLYTNDGAGSLSYQSTLLPTQSGTLRHVILGDVNGDQVDDIVLAQTENSNARILAFLSAAGAHVQTTGTHENGYISLSADSLALGDLDGDGVPELVSVVSGVDSQATSDLRIHQLAPSGANLFASATYINVGPHHTTLGVAMADLNNDGQLDAAVVRNGDVLRLNGDGQGNLLPAGLTGHDNRTLAYGDINGDGRAELVAGGPLLTTVYHKSAVSEELVPGQVLSPSNLAALADANGDGHLDVFLLNGSLLTVCINDGTGQMTALPDITLPTVPDTMELGDLNGDGNADIVLGTSTSTNLSVLLSAGPAAYAAPTSVALTGSVRGLSLGDIDGDGTLDIVAALGTDVIEILANTAEGYLSTLVPLPGVLANGVATADLNSDGLLDIVVAGQSGTGFGALTQVMNQGSMSLVASPSLPVPGLRYPSEVRVRDANGDSVLDVLVMDRDAYGCAVYTGLGAGEGFTSGSLLFTGGQPASSRSLAFVDLDGDGVIEPFYAHFRSSGPSAVSIVCLLALLGGNALRRRRRAA